MHWIARRPKTTTRLPQADLAGADAGACDDPPPDTGELLAAAEPFIALFHGENPGAGTLSARMLSALTLFPRGSDQVIPQVLAVFLFYLSLVFPVGTTREGLLFGR
jgi:hypothetical protein